MNYVRELQVYKSTYTFSHVHVNNYCAIVTEINESESGISLIIFVLSALNPYLTLFDKTHNPCSLAS